MSAPDFSLLAKRRYGPLFVVQFLGAFNDNVLKFAMLLLANFTLYATQPEKSAMLATIATGLFILPYFIFSALAGQIADSLDKAKSIWCSKDKIKAWDDQLVNNIAPTAAGTCDTSAIDKTLAFGKQKNISGTPTMFFVDGQRVPGAIPGEMIEQRLAAAK